MERIHRIKSSIPLGWPWIVFWVCMLGMDIPGGTNASSRYATLKALVEDQSFAITAYQGDTADWAQTPNGSIYSNKAPGPVLIALPAFWVWDTVTTGGLSERTARDARREKMGFTALKVLGFLFQVLPLAILVALASQWVVAPALVWATVLCGTTAALFLNNFFGHGMAAVFVLAACMALLKERTRWAGLALGLGVLCDYGVALLVLPALVWAWRRRGLGDLVRGGLGPFLIFAGYHWACFGAPWSLPMQFQNPEFVDTAHGLWGVLNYWPGGHAAVELLVGPSRGLLWTAPWVFLLPFVVRRHPTMGYGLAGLGLLLLMNSAFGAWHGGHTAGPRYLSPVLPSLVFQIAILWDRLDSRLTQWLSVTLALGLVVQLGIFVSAVMPPPGIPLWEAIGRGLWSPTALVRGVALVGVWWGVRRLTPPLTVPHQTPT